MNGLGDVTQIDTALVATGDGFYRLVADGRPFGKLVAALEKAHTAGLVVRELFLARGSVGAKGAALLAASPALATVESIHFGAAKIGDDGLATLCASPHAGALSALAWFGDTITSAGVAACLSTRPLASRLVSRPVSENAKVSKTLSRGASAYGGDAEGRAIA